MLSQEEGAAVAAVTTLVNLDKARQSGAKAHPPQDRADKGQVFLVVQQQDQVMEYILTPRPGHPQVDL